MYALYTAILVVGGGPFCVAIDQAAPPVPVVETTTDIQWDKVAVASTTIQLPKMEPTAYQRQAPSTFKAPRAIAYKSLWCPQHGYRCGMQQAVEDLAGHLQSSHRVTLERLNKIGRDKWSDLHDDLHYKQQKAQPTQAVQSSGCAGGSCPASQSRGLFRWR